MTAQILLLHCWLEVYHLSKAHHHHEHPHHPTGPLGFRRRPPPGCRWWWWRKWKIFVIWAHRCQGLSWWGLLSVEHQCCYCHWDLEEKSRVTAMWNWLYRQQPCPRHCKNFHFRHCLEISFFYNAFLLYISLSIFLFLSEESQDKSSTMHITSHWNGQNVLQV